MGGGIARAELAAAVSEAGGLGTLGMMAPAALRSELRAVRAATAKPVALNLLLPFTRRDHWEIAREADLLVTFWGRPRRRSGRPWIHQCGAVEEALDAVAAGADAVIAQGVEAGGHVRGTEPALELLDRVRAALPAGFPVLVAGGIADTADVRRALEAGAAAAVAGTRFLLSDESAAHPEYKRRAAAGRDTVLTELFGTGWPAPHRVLPNAATERWLGREPWSAHAQRDPRGPHWMRALHHATGPAVRRAPERLAAVLARTQRAGTPLLGPQPATVDGPAGLVDAGPLYAGTTVERIADVRPAGELVRELAA